MFVGAERGGGLFGVQGRWREQGDGIDLPVGEHLVQMTPCRVDAGCGLALGERVRVGIAETGHSTARMIRESVHPRPAESQSHYGDA